MRNTTINAAVDTVGHRDPARVAECIGAWLAGRWPGASIAGFRAPSGSGASSELFILDLLGLPGDRDGTTPAVLKLNSSWPVYPTVDLEMQALCMGAARRGGLPAPAVLAVEPASPPLSIPFLLMERLSGRAAPDFPSYVREGWLHDLPPPAQARLWNRGVETLAALHAVELSPQEQRRCQLPVQGTSAVERMAAYWRLFLQHVELNGDYPELARSVDWLCDNTPAGPVDEGLVWGDASLRNMLFGEGEVCAILDFEFAHCGVQAFDIAFYAMMDHIMATGFAGGAPRLAGFPGVDATLDYYESCTGRRVAHREYWLRSALTYSALSTTRVYQRLAARGQVAAEEVGENPPLVMLRSVLEGNPLPA